MSRVKTNQKWMNVPRGDRANAKPSKITRVHSENENYHKASSLSSWLFIKYDMQYTTYRKKSKHRREELREEYQEDTKTE